MQNIGFCRDSSARFSRKAVSGKKPPALEGLAAHLPIVPLNRKNLLAKIATNFLKFSGIKDKFCGNYWNTQFYFDQSEPCT